MTTKKMNSPCNGECEINDDGFCLGCYRTIEEIAAWTKMTDGQRLEVLDKCLERRKAEEGPET